MKQLFISYSRKDIDFARRLTESFAAKDFDAWVDWQDIPPSVDWMQQIQMGIEQADIFLYIVSPDSITSEVCSREISHAVLNGKRIIPIIAREFETTRAPQTISHLNWIFFSRSQDIFEEAFEKILTSIHTDYAWVQAHSRLQTKALEWERSEREDSLLLRGRELENAQSQLSVNDSKDPLPTSLQREFISKSSEVEKVEVEKARAKEQQLELEKSMASRLKRLTYILVGIFTLAFIALFVWLNKITSDLAVNSIKHQMIALVETSVPFIRADDFEELTQMYSGSDSKVYTDNYYVGLTTFLTNVKRSNKNIKNEWDLYTVVPADKDNEFLIVTSTTKEIPYKTQVTGNELSRTQIVGLERTVADTTVYFDEFGSWISACTPILKSQTSSVGALCADFSAELLNQTRNSVLATLGIIFVVVYPVMIGLIVFTTGSFRKGRQTRG